MAVFISAKEDLYPGLSNDAPITFWNECMCDSSEDLGSVEPEPMEFQKPGPRVMRSSVLPFGGIQERGLPMENPIEDPFGPFKIPDERTRLYTAHALPMLQGRDLPPAMLSNQPGGI